MKFNKLAIAILVVLVVAILIIGCQTKIIGKVVDSEKPESIKIGFIAPLTGEVASTGIANMRGVELAVDDINARGGIAGKSVKLIAEDDQLIDKLTINAYYKLTDIDNVDAILSISYGGLLSLAPVIDKENFVIVDSLDTSEELAAAGEYLFAVGIYDESYGYSIADFIYEKLKKDKVALIFNNQDPILQMISDAFKQKFVDERGGKIIIEQTYGIEERDFRSILLKIDKKGIDTIVVLGFDEAGFILKQAKDLGLEFTFLGWDQFVTKGFLEAAGDAAEGAYMTYWDAPDTEKLNELIEKYKEKYKEEPHDLLFTVVGYDSMTLTAEAMEKAIEQGKQPRGEALHDELYKIKDLDAISGKLTMSYDGVVRSIQESIFQLKDGKPVKIE